MNKDLTIIAQNSGAHAAALTKLFYEKNGLEDVPADNLLETFKFFQQGVLEAVVAIASPSATSAGDAVAAISQAFPGAEAVSREEYAPSGDGVPYATEQFTGGKFRGKTIQEVFDSGADGVGYLRWTASDKCNNEYMKKRVSAFLAAAA